MNLRLLLLLTILSSYTSNAYRILGICPTPAKSHQMFFHTLMQALASQGHELVLLTTDPIKTDNPNITQIDWSSSYHSQFSQANWAHVRGLSVIKLALHDIPDVLDKSLSHPTIASMIKNYQNDHFDAVIVEYVGYTPMYAFAELYNAPMIGFSSLEIDANQHEVLGNGVHPVLHNPNIFGYYHSNTIYKRVWNTFAYFTGACLYEVFDRMFDRLITKHFGTRVKATSIQLARQVDLVLLNSSPFLGFVRPTVPNVIPIGFIHIQPYQRTLPVKIKQFLDEADTGAIYFSFGTMVKSQHLEESTVLKYLRAFRGLKYKVLWKSDRILERNLTDKIYTADWFPQQDVLGLKKFYNRFQI